MSLISSISTSAASATNSVPYLGHKEHPHGVSPFDYSFMGETDFKSLDGYIDDLLFFEPCQLDPRESNVLD